MPVQSQFGTLSIGKDISVNVTLPSGAQLIIANITSYDRKPKQTPLLSKGLDGVNRTATIPDTWELAFDVDRQDAVLDQFFAALEALYFSGGTVQNATILETIQEADGSVSQYRYQGCALRYDDAGMWKSDSFVKTRVHATCSKRVLVS